MQSQEQISEIKFEGDKHTEENKVREFLKIFDSEAIAYIEESFNIGTNNTNLSIHPLLCDFIQDIQNFDKDNKKKFFERYTDEKYGEILDEARKFTFNARKPTNYKLKQIADPRGEKIDPKKEENDRIKKHQAELSEMFDRCE